MTTQFPPSNTTGSSTSEITTAMQWKIVPENSTLEMQLAGGHVNSEWLNDNAPVGADRFTLPIKGVFKAMLAAAPTPLYELEQCTNLADRLDAMADFFPAGSQAQSDLFAAATVWRKHTAPRHVVSGSETLEAMVEDVIALLFKTASGHLTGADSSRIQEYGKGFARGFFDCHKIYEVKLRIALASVKEQQA